MLSVIWRGSTATAQWFLIMCWVELGLQLNSTVDSQLLPPGSLCETVHNQYDSIMWTLACIDWGKKKTDEIPAKPARIRSNAPKRKCKALLLLHHPPVSALSECSSGAKVKEHIRSQKMSPCRTWDILRGWEHKVCPLSVLGKNNSILGLKAV
jgi:hypothetical protein